MTAYTKNSAAVLHIWRRLLGSMLTVTLLIPFAVMSQSPATVTNVKNGFVPQEFALFQNYPNPFNPSTRIQYSLKNATQVSLKIYNLLGIEVATLVNNRQEAGSYTVQFSTSNGTLSLSSGVYFYCLEAGSFVSTKKFILMK